MQRQYLTQPRQEETKNEYQTNIPKSENVNMASYKTRQAYNTLVNTLDQESPGFGKSEDITKLKSDELSDMIKNSQK